MDEKLIAVAASAVVKDLQLDCEVASVYQRKDSWCVKFSGSYGEFCDAFRSRYGDENSAQVVREKIKRYLLKSPKPTGRRKGFSKRSSFAGPENSLLDIPLQIAEGALEQTARLAGELIGETINAAETAIKTAADAALTTAQVISEPTELQTGIIIAANDNAPPSITEIHPATTKRATKRATRSATKKASKKAARKTSKKKALKS
ncbi:MAG: hypothetical protein QOD00_3149 [Blastocatellia bacterium]|jgi:hypothetical protein|nr:hypothetical protein [Blastocatellia bacterium]